MPAVRLNDHGVGAGAGPGPGPGFPTPPAPSAVRTAPPAGPTQVPAFTVASSIAGTSGPNAILTPEAGTLLADS
ncbi:MAG TPA: hypothetical protein VE604_01730, partial [Candidatus Polarisedimenticolia bacterium]|nr:hypothetical protein [Candidatus Polarisedimenticolia bacterium]